MPFRRRLSRALRLAAACGLLTAGVVFLLVPAGAQTGDTGSFAQFNNEGWWQKNAFPPNVPANGLAVAAEGGEPSRVTAFGMDIHVGAGEVLSSLTLTLKENTAPGANYPPPPPEQATGQVPAQAQVVVVACPIIELYTPAKAGDYGTEAPEADCDAARGDGVRSPDGTWEFDLTSLAELWESNALENKGVLLVERVAAPMSFQVVFQDLSTNTPMLDLATDIVIDETDTTTDTSTTPDETFVEEVPAETGGDNFFADIADNTTGTPTTPLGIVDTPPTTAPAAPEVAPEPPTDNVVNRRPTKGTLPPIMLLLPLLVAGLALVGGFVLGPEGDPSAARRREGGLSRALAKREAMDASE